MSLYLKDVRRFRPLDAEQESLLFVRLDAGDTQVRDELVCRHLGLVIALARKFSNRGLELLDLIEEGNLGMLVALEKFEPARGLRFSTYAVWWIRHYLQTAIATQVPIVRPPLRAQRRAGQAAWAAWDADHGGESGQTQAHPTPNADGDPVPSAPQAGSLVSSVALHDEDVEAQLMAANLCHPDVAHAVADQLDSPRLARLLHRLVDALPPVQRRVVVARFGLDGSDECTLQDLGTERGVSRERMRQVQATALATLRTGLEQAGVSRMAALA
jgi:RNA polymerase sigma factor (sigma-70 family)